MSDNLAAVLPLPIILPKLSSLITALQLPKSCFFLSVQARGSRENLKLEDLDNSD